MASGPYGPFLARSANHAVRPERTIESEPQEHDRFTWLALEAHTLLGYRSPPPTNAPSMPGVVANNMASTSILRRPTPS